MVFPLHHQFSSHCLPAPSKGASHPHPSPSCTMSLPGSHRKLQCQLSTPHPPGPRLGTGLAWPRRVGTRPPNSLPGLGLRGTVDALLLTLCLPFFRGCSASTYPYTHPGFRSPPCRLSPTTPPPPPPASSAHLHTVIRFLRSTATLREDAFLEDSPRAMVVWTKLASIQMCGHCCRRQLPPTPPGAPAPSRDHGWALCPPEPRDPSTAIPLPLLGCRPLAPSPRRDSGAKQGRGGSSPRC